MSATVNTRTIDWQAIAGTVYGGTLDVTNGVLTVDRANIPSYNGETLPGEWISDRDVYAPGTTPTIGAQVVYTLATPITIQLTPQEIQTLKGLNNIWADTGDVTVTFVGTPSEDESPRNAMNILLGGAYNRNGSDPSDREALNIILGR